MVHVGRRPRLCADQPGALAQHCAFRHDGFTHLLPHTPASGALCVLAGVLVEGGPHKEQPPSPETLQLLASVSPPEIRGQAPTQMGASGPEHRVGSSQAARAGMEGLSGIGGRVRRAGPQGGHGGLARVGRLRAGIPSGQLGLFSPLRKVVAVAGSESPGLLAGLVLREEGGRVRGRRARPAATINLSRLFAAEGSMGLAWPPHARTVTSLGRWCVSFVLVTSSC